MFVTLAMSAAVEEAAVGLKAEVVAIRVGKAVVMSNSIMGILVSFNPPRKGCAAARGGWIVPPTILGTKLLGWAGRQTDRRTNGWEKHNRKINDGNDNHKYAK